jgi:hypothetical protein
MGYFVKVISVHPIITVTHVQNREKERRSAVTLSRKTQRFCQLPSWSPDGRSYEHCRASCACIGRNSQTRSIPLMKSAHLSFLHTLECGHPNVNNLFVVLALASLLIMLNVSPYCIKFTVTVPSGFSVFSGVLCEVQNWVWECVRLHYWSRFWC